MSNRERGPINAIMRGLILRRKALGITQQSIADRMEPPVSQSWISDLETGRIKNPGIVGVAAYAKVVGLRLALKEGI
jgi:predicted transcriptional regulator